MFKLVVICAALCLAVQAEIANEIELDNLLEDELGDEFGSTRMAGGSLVTDATAYTYVVAIQPKYDIPAQPGQAAQTGVLAPACSGVLINGRTAGATAGTITNVFYVLTSAHCALSGTSFDIYLGQKTVDVTAASNETVASTNVIVNNEYRQSMLTGDIALIRLTTFAALPADGSVTAATLGDINDASRSYVLNPVRMAGWGYPSDVFGANSPRLRELSSWVVPNWYCAVRHITLPIRSTHICTAGLPNRGPCTGDSGAPLVADVRSTDGRSTSSRVIGVATHTPRSSCNRGKPGVFTRVGDYLNWIVAVTGYLTQ